MARTRRERRMLASDRPLPDLTLPPMPAASQAAVAPWPVVDRYPIVIGSQLSMA